MMFKLLKKDFALCMHPCTLLFLSFAAMVFIPSYPYSLVVFYSGLSFFFTCINGRENKDVIYSLLLPVAKSDVVKSRMLFALTIQSLQVFLIAILCPVSQLANPAGNSAGLRAGLVFVAWSIFQYAVFNALFFSVYYENVQKVGKAFVVASSVLFLLIAAEVVGVYAVPFVRDVLNSKDPEHLGVKLGFLGVSLACYALSYVLTQKNAVKQFERQDF